MADALFDIGMIGLGVMGKNLSLNMADHGYSVAGYDLDPEKVKDFQPEAPQQRIQGASSLAGMIKMLKKPRAVILLVPAGPAVDAVIRDISPFFEPGDMLIDSGNSFFKDTELRQKTLTAKGILMLGMGISGGEVGAREGPSLMPGGPREGFDRVREILEAVAAHVDGDPCCAYCGPGGAGHYVKMVHNGLEYGLMELIAETYDLMKRGLQMDDEEIGQTFSEWNRGELNSYLLEITGRIFAKKDSRTGKRLVDVILDEAKQKGTGKWTSQEAMDQQVPAFTIDTAVAMRDLSGLKDQREQATRVLAGPDPCLEVDKAYFLNLLHQGLYFGSLMTFTQGMAILQAASGAYRYDLHLETIAKIWRGGCIIRSALLEPIRAAFRAKPDLLNLLFDPSISGEAIKQHPAMRKVITSAAEAGIPAAGYMASLAYYDAFRSGWLPANLIQAQRDYFGAHSYERNDEKGNFHTVWEA